MFSWNNAPNLEDIETKTPLAPMILWRGIMHFSKLSHWNAKT